MAYANRIVALFLVPAYSGAIMSFIVYPNIKLPFRDVRGLVEDGSYKMAYDARSEEYNWFKVGRLMENNIGWSYVHCIDISSLLKIRGPKQLSINVV